MEMWAPQAKYRVCLGAEHSLPGHHKWEPRERVGMQSKNTQPNRKEVCPTRLGLLTLLELTENRDLVNLEFNAWWALKALPEKQSYPMTGKKRSKKTSSSSLICL